MSTHESGNELSVLGCPLSAKSRYQPNHLIKFAVSLNAIAPIPPR
jgi:hypothetical protein